MVVDLLLQWRQIRGQIDAMGLLDRRTPRRPVSAAAIAMRSQFGRVSSFSRTRANAIRNGVARSYGCAVGQRGQGGKMNLSEPVGTVRMLWRFPVKSMLGEHLEMVDVGEGGIVGDRAYAVRDRETGKIASAKHPKLWPNLLACRAAFVEPPRPGDGLPRCTSTSRTATRCPAMRRMPTPSCRASSDAVVKEGSRLPADWDASKVRPEGRPDSAEFPLPHGYFWGPMSGPEQCISGEYPEEPQAWRDGLGRWQEALGLPVTKKWDDGKTPQAATTLQLEKHWASSPGIGYGCVNQGEWDAVIKAGWRLPPGWDASKVERGGPASSSAAIAVSEVRYEKGGFAKGEAAYRDYLAKTLDLFDITDQSARANRTRGVLVAAVRESSYDPDAVNEWDINARGPRMPDGARASCSRGVIQTIPATFASNHQPGTSTNIYDPIANTAAAMNYVMKRYGVSRDGSNLAAAVCQFNPRCGPRGY